jgi:TRAP transporter TAXI family solute receptor
MPLLLVTSMMMIHRQRQAMPQRVYIAGGSDGGIYTEVSRKLAQRLRVNHEVKVIVTPTEGSIDNRERLITGEIHLAPMEASAISGDTLCVVAPLFYEAVHVMVRDDSNIKTMNDLQGHRVAVGPRGSGSRATTEYVFESLDFPAESIAPEEIAWPDLYRDDSPDAAIICIGYGSHLVSDLLVDGRWKLIPIPNCVPMALRHPTLRPMTIHQQDYPADSIPAGGIDTVGTTAFLASRLDAPAALVEAALHAIYEEPVFVAGLISRDRAAEWQGLAFHPVARKFFLDRQE